MSLILKNAEILDTNHVYEKVDVLIEGEIIIAISKNMSYPAGKVVDLGGMTLLPCFIDAHVHVTTSDNFSEKPLESWVLNGVTTVRECGLLCSRSLEDYLDWMQSYVSDNYTNVVLTGKVIDIASEYGAGPGGVVTGLLVKTRGQAADKVDYLKSMGCNGIKIGINHQAAPGQTGDLIKMPPEFVKAICDAARKNDMFITAHVKTANDLKMLVDNGITDAGHTPIDRMSDSLVRQMAESSIGMVTTVATPITGSGGSDVMLDMPAGMVPAGHRGQGGPGGPGGPGDLSPQQKAEREAVEKAQKAVSLDNLKRLHDAGGAVAVGTDVMRSSDWSKTARIPFLELAALNSVGFSMQDCIRAGTINAAKLCGIDNEVGSIEVGKKANFVAIKGQVDDKFSVFESVPFVVNRGVIIK